MIPRSKLILLFLLLAVTVCNSFTLPAQKLRGQSLIDSLKKELDKATSDTQQCKLLTRLAYANATLDTELGIRYGNEALALGKKAKWKKGIAHSLYYRGICYMYGAKYPEALEDFLKAIPLFEELDDKDKLAGTLGNVGGVFAYQGKSELALSYYLKALKLNRSIEPGSNFEAANLANIGLLYEEKNDYPNALRYLEEARTICEKGNHTDMLPSILESLSAIYLNKNESHKSYHFAIKGLELGKKIQDLNIIAHCYRNLGAAIKNALEKNDNLLLDSLRKHHRDLPRLARRFLDSALQTSQETGNLMAIAESYSQSAELEEFMGNFQTALGHHKQYKLFHDSMYNDDNKEKILQSTLEHEFERKTAEAKALQEKKDIKQKLIRNAIAAGLLLVLGFALIVFRQRNRISAEKKRSDDLLLNILPQQVAEELKLKGSTEAIQFDEVTVLFTDFVDFTGHAEKLSPKELVSEIDYCFRAFDHIIQKYGIEKIKTIGDAYMAAAGLPTPNLSHATEVVQAALDMLDFMKRYKAEREAIGKVPFEIRIGVHTGPVVAGIVGVKKFAYDIWGDTVNTANRMESSGEAGMVNISEVTYQQVKDKFKCTYRGKVSAKGKGDIDMYFAEPLM